MGKNSLDILASDELPKTQMLSRLNEFGSETVAAMNVTPHSPHKFSAHISRVNVGTIGLTWVKTAASTMSVRGGAVGTWASQLGGSFLLVVQEFGTCIATYRGKDIVVNPGDVFLLNPSMHLPWRVINNSPMSNLTLKIPETKLLGLVKDTEPLSGMRLGADNPRFRTGASMIMASKHIIEDNPEEDWDDAYADLLMDIISTTFLKGVNDSGGTGSRALRRRACFLIERQLMRSDFDVASLTTELNTNIRTLQRAFVAEGMTPSQYILERRIALAAEKLKCENDDASIAGMAFSVGFNDVSYFSRCFRKRFGMSPREYRAGKTRSDAPRIPSSDPSKRESDDSPQGGSR